MADSYKDKIIDELIALRDSRTLNPEQKKYVKALANHLVDLDDASVKKTLYATFKEPSLQGGVFRSTLSVLPEDSEISTTLISEKPKYAPPKSETIAEAFKNGGGAEVLDERSPNYWAMNPNINKAKLRAVAKSQGMTEDELIKALEQETLKETRRQIRYGEDVGKGWLSSPEAFTSRAAARVLGLTMPRTMQLVEEGKGLRENASAPVEDVLENVLYVANPIGRGLGAGMKALGTRAFGKALLEDEAKRKAFGIGKNVVNAFGTPALMNVTETIAEGTPADPYNILYGGITNLVGNRMLKNRAGRLMKSRSDIGSVKKAISSEGGNAAQPTFKEFEKGLDKAIKERKKISGNVSQREAMVSLSPKQRMTMEKVKPVFSGDADLDVTATEIAKIVGKRGVSLEKATDIYFTNLAKKKSPAYVESVVEKMNDRKNKVFEIGEGGKVLPNQNLYNLINESSWGDVFTTEFAKKPRANKVSPTRKFLLGELEGTTPPDYAHWIQNKFSTSESGRNIGKSAANIIPVLDAEEHEKEKERRKKEEEERRYRAGYIFNPSAGE